MYCKSLEPIIGSAAPLIVPAEKPISSEPLRASLENSDNTRRLYQLQRIPGFRGYGFTVNSNQVGPPAHKIAEIYPNSPAQQQGRKNTFNKPSRIFFFSSFRSTCWR